MIEKQKNKHIEKQCIVIKKAAQQTKGTFHHNTCEGYIKNGWDEE